MDDVLKRHPAIDMHSRLGRFHETPGGGIDSLNALRAGDVLGCVAATIADRAVIARGERGLRAVKGPDPGELFQTTIDDLDSLGEAIASTDAVLATTAGHLLDAWNRGRPAVVSGIEGGDFLEEDLEKLEDVYRRDVRLIQLVHCRINELGDIQTEPPRHGGLTDFGRNAVREMDRLGIVVDLAHATFDTCRGAVAVTDNPVILSHTVVGDRHPRCISADHACLVAETGGVVGAWPSKLAVRDFDDFIDAILRLVEIIGADHVGIGTDMDGVKDPVYSGYKGFAAIPRALLDRGLSTGEVAKAIGGNFVRVFAAVAGN